MGTRVYVGRLSYDARERDLEKFFKGYGRIREVLMKNGFGFVEFDDYRDADDAVYELNGKELLGERVTVAPARGPMRRNDYGGSRGRGWRTPARRWGDGRERYGPPTRTEYRIIVENLSSQASWQDLKDYMRQAGEVTYADAHKQRRNEGVVEFASYSDMKNAIDKLDDTELNGKRIKLIEEKSRRKSRSRSRSKSRSPSRSRSRSRSQSRSKSRSKSRSPSHSRSKSRSHSKSKSPEARSPSPKSRSKSREKSRSRSRSPSKSPSKSPVADVEKSPEITDKE